MDSGMVLDMKPSNHTMLDREKVFRLSRTEAISYHMTMLTLTRTRRTVTVPGSAHTQVELFVPKSL